MPTLARLPSIRSHSCCSVYFTSSGNSISPPRRSFGPAERVGCCSHLFQRPFPDLVRGRIAAPASSLGDPAFQKLADPVTTTGAVAEPSRPRGDSPIPALGTLPEVLSARELSPLGPRLAIDLNDVEGEVDHGGVRDRRSDPIRVSEWVQLEDVGLVDAPGDEDLHVRKSPFVQLPPDLAKDGGEVSPAACRGVQADGGEVPPQGQRRRHRPELLVLEGVHQSYSRDPG